MNTQYLREREVIAFNKGITVNKDGKAFNSNGKQIGFQTKNGNYIYNIIKVRDPFDKKSIPVKIARLQAYQKYGDKIYESGMVIRHLDGNSTNDSYDNIKIGTYSENNLDIPPKQRQLNCLGSTKSTRKYSDELLIQIRKEKAEGARNFELCNKYNIPKSTMCHILKTKYLHEKIADGDI